MLPMAKIDKFFQQLVLRGASLLRLDPGDPPVVELPGGHRVSLSGVEMLGTVLDGLAKEILPDAAMTAFLRGEKVNFEHTVDGTVFQVLCCRSPLGTRLVAARFASTVQAVGAEQVSLDSLEPLIIKLLNDSGSDLYLDADASPLVRLDGRLEAVKEYGELPAKRLEELVRAWVPARTWEQFSSGQDTEFCHSDPERSCRLRVSLLHDQAAPSVSVRVIPREIPDADTLGLGDPVRRLAQLNKGLVLLTGPMGSGKSTTLACLLNLANAGRKGYVITIQDSIEFEFPGGQCLIRQREVGCDPVRQAQAIRAALRQAPDILSVGEIRDGRSLELALQAVQTGRTVFATLATASMADTLFTLADSCAPEHRARILSRLAESLKAILGHTLLPRIGGGQVVAMETLFNNPALAGLIREGRFGQLGAVSRQGRYGQVSHEEALVQLILNRKVEPLDAYLRCQDREAFIGACRKAEIAFDPRSSGQITEL
jgi:twitching motility protein PilT